MTLQGLRGKRTKAMRRARHVRATWKADSQTDQVVRRYIDIARFAHRQILAQLRLVRMTDGTLNCAGRKI